MKKPFAIIVCASLAFASGALAGSSAPPDGASIVLASQLMRDQAGGRDLEPMLVSAAAAFSVSMGEAAKPARLAAWRQAVHENRPMLDAETQSLAEVYARTLTKDEMRTWIAYLESPAGMAIQARKLAAVGSLRPADLTADQQAAEAAFNASPEAKSIKAKNGVLLVESLQRSLLLGRKLAASAEVDYCHATGDCKAAR
jgi:hypothetical protein